MPIFADWVTWVSDFLWNSSGECLPTLGDHGLALSGSCSCTRARAGRSTELYPDPGLTHHQDMPLPKRMGHSWNPCFRSFWKIPLSFILGCPHLTLNLTLEPASNSNHNPILPIAPQSLLSRVGTSEPLIPLPHCSVTDF